MKMTPIAPILLSMLICGFAGATEVLFSGEKKQNNLVSELLEAASISKTGTPLTFTCSSEGWIFISANYKGQGCEARVTTSFDSHRRASDGDEFVKFNSRRRR
jgi:hypothetical protein